MEHYGICIISGLASGKTYEISVMSDKSFDSIIYEPSGKASVSKPTPAPTAKPTPKPTPKPIQTPAPEPLQITEVYTDLQGNTLVRWRGGQAWSYVSYVHASDGMSIPVGVQATENKSVYIRALAPGEGYYITVESGDEYITYTHYVPEVGNYHEFNIGLEYTSLRYQNPDATDWDMCKLPAKKGLFIRNNLQKLSFWASTRFDVSRLKRDVNYKLLTVLHTPDCSVYTAEYDINLDSDYKWHEWCSLKMNKVFSDMLSYYGYIYPGRYTVDTYLDYKYFGSDYFDVDASDYYGK